MQRIKLKSASSLTPAVKYPVGSHVTLHPGPFTASMGWSPPDCRLPRHCSAADALQPLSRHRKSSFRPGSREASSLTRSTAKGRAPARVMMLAHEPESGSNAPSMTTGREEFARDLRANSTSALSCLTTRRFGAPDLQACEFTTGRHHPIHQCRLPASVHALMDCLCDDWSELCANKVKQSGRGSIWRTYSL